MDWTKSSHNISYPTKHIYNRTVKKMENNSKSHVLVQIIVSVFRFLGTVIQMNCPYINMEKEAVKAATVISNFCTLYR